MLCGNLPGLGGELSSDNGSAQWYRSPIARGPQTHEHGGIALHLPSPRVLVGYALPSVLDGLIVPTALFYMVLMLDDFQGALYAALGWAYLAIVRRIVKRERVAGVLVLSAVLLTFRTALALASGSSFVYFVQPAGATVLVALAFFTSVVIGRPLTEKLAQDFCPLDPQMLTNTHVRKFFMRLSLLWAVVLMSNAGLVLWLLVASSLRSFVVEKTAVTVGLTVAGIAVSVFWFIYAMRTNGISVSFGTVAGPQLVPAEPLGPAPVETGT